ncbi:MAG TPA: hypothetical protein DIT05_06440 [Morganella sp. (in: Bacteria)]|nr:hypothetical protein [Morganella sp. (in: enterobacteria)]
MADKKNKYFSCLFTVPVTAIFMLSFPVLANKSNHSKNLSSDVTINRLNSDETGNAFLSFYGVISEAPCHINMDSQEQVLDIDTIVTNHNSDKPGADQQLPFSITLKECSPVLSLDDSFYQGNISLLKMRFINHVTLSGKNNSKQKIDIVISDRYGGVIPFGVYDYPEMNSGNDQDLLFNISVDNSRRDNLISSYQGVISFELDYD